MATTAFETVYGWGPKGQKTTEYGKPEYQEATKKWGEMYGTYSGLMKETQPASKEMMDYYKPGGGYGEGRRQEAKETTQAGVSQDLAGMVATGMSSSAGARGLQTLAGTQLGKMYKDIEDTRNQLWQQAMTPYAQMMTSLSQFAQSMPTYGQYVSPVTTTEYGKIPTGKIAYEQKSTSEISADMDKSKQEK